MSHVTVIKSVPIKSISALYAAVTNLQEKGIKCKLEKDCRPAMYAEHQEVLCPYVLRLEDSKFDIGFQKEKDSESYDILMDTYAGHLKNVLGTEGKNDNNHIGLLLQEYSKEAAKEAAFACGMMVEECYMDEDENVVMIFQ